MQVYLIIDMVITDLELYAEYVGQVSAVVQKYGGTLLAREGNIFVVTGDWHPKRIILIEFESLDHVQEFFSSPDYLALAPLREQSTLSRSIIIEGCGP